MGPDDVPLRDMETTEDMEYWEGELDDEQITVAELVQGNWAANRTCYHCREVGHTESSVPSTTKREPQDGKIPYRPWTRDGTSRTTRVPELKGVEVLSKLGIEGRLRGRGRPFQREIS